MYSPASVCRRGHVDSPDISTGGDWLEDGLTQRPPGKYCSGCGAEVLMGCESCKAPIRGIVKIPGVIVTGRRPYMPPRFCHSCGLPYPWADRQTRLGEIENLIVRHGLAKGADELELREVIERLGNPELSDEKGVAGWSRVMSYIRHLPSEVGKTAQSIATELVNDYIRRKVGLD